MTSKEIFKGLIDRIIPTLSKTAVMPRYFVPKSQLLHLTIGKKYFITYTKKGRQIKDDRGIERIVRPLPSEIGGEVHR